MKNTLPQETIDSIRNMGFKVYMRNPTDSYAYVESENGICYIQYNYMSGYNINTVHKPNISSGTGCRMYTEVSITKERLEVAIRTVMPFPGVPLPTKYKNMAEYIKSDKFSSTYKEVI